MKYTAESIAVPAFEDALEQSRVFHQQMAETAKKEADAYYKGWSDCAAHVSEMLHCSNYEDTKASSPERAYLSGVDTAFYELCKELDVGSQDIRENEKMSVDEKAAHLAARIKEVLTGTSDPS